MPGPSLLFDTPEDIGQSLEREKVRRVRRVIYTHWHPDHTMGRRVFEQLNWRIFKPSGKLVTDVWLPSWVRRDFQKYLGLEDHFRFFEKLGIVKVHEVLENEPVHMDGVTIRAYRMAQPGLSAFLVRRKDKRVLLALDDTRDWLPPNNLLAPDLLVTEAGWFEKDPRGRVIVPADHSVRRYESSFEDVLKLVEYVGPKRTFLTHIEESSARSYSDYLRLERKFGGLGLRFAFDGLRVTL